MSAIIETMRKAIQHAEQTRYRIAHETGVAQSQLSRIVRGETGMSVETLERLADYLGLEIMIRPKSRRKES